MPQSGRELIFAVRWRVIARYFGQFCVIIALLNLANLAVALSAAELAVARYYALIILLLLLLGLLLTRIKTKGRMQVNEAMVLGCLVFVAIPLLMSAPLCAQGVPFVDALFETVSAATTTGLSTLGSVDQLSKTSLFARAWMQWYGGLGIVVLSLALVVRPGMTAMRLGMMEVSDHDLVGGTKAHARHVLKVYLGLTVVGLLAWWLSGGAAWDGFLYILPAVSTGGFAPSSGSLADLPAVRLAWIVTLTCFAGAIPLALYHDAWRKGWRTMVASTEAKALLSCCLLLTLLLGCSLWWEGMALDEVLRHAPLQAVSAQSTAGFSSFDLASLGPASKALMILAMATGGGIGSTAGGFKLLRLMILLRVMHRCIRTMSVPPNAVIITRLDGRKLEDPEIQDALMIILAFATVIVISWIPFLLSGHAPLDALFDVVSATGTVGLSTGLSTPGLSTPLKLVLCADMLFGRLEILAWLVFFYPRTWFGRHRE